PAAPARDQFVQILHLATIEGRKGVINVVPRRREADHRTTVVDPQPPGTGPTQCAKIDHHSVAQSKGMRGSVLTSVSLSRDLVLVINGVGDAPIAPEGADWRHRSILVGESEKVTPGVIGVADDNSKV